MNGLIVMPQQITPTNQTQNPIFVSFLHSLLFFSFISFHLSSIHLNSIQLTFFESSQPHDHSPPPCQSSRESRRCSSLIPFSKSPIQREKLTPSFHWDSSTLGERRWWWEQWWLGLGRRPAGSRLLWCWTWTILSILQRLEDKFWPTCEKHPCFEFHRQTKSNENRNQFCRNQTLLLENPTKETLLFLCRMFCIPCPVEFCSLLKCITHICHIRSIPFWDVSKSK